jgi:membrane protein
MKVPADARAHAALIAAHAIVSTPAVQAGPRVAPIGSRVIAKAIDAVKANPRRFAIAAAGASLFMFMKGAHPDDTRRRS